MKRILILSVLALALFGGGAVSSGQVGGGKLPSRVPKGKTFVYFDGAGAEVGRTKSGQRARRANITDCAQVPCPSTFGPDIVCWKCVARPSTLQRR
jgi:hypothetical protein